MPLLGKVSKKNKKKIVEFSTKGGGTVGSEAVLKSDIQI